MPCSKTMDMLAEKD